MSTEPAKHDHFKDVSWASFQVAIGMFAPQVAWIIPAFNFLRGETRRKPTKDWQAAVHKALQELDKRVSQLEGGGGYRQKIEGLSHLVAVYLVKELADDLSNRTSREDLLSAFPQISSDELDEAVMELKEDGYAKTHEAIGHLYVGVRPSPELIFMYDPLIYGWFSAADAVALYRLMEEKPCFKSMMKLQPAIGWELRRFNAAQLYLKERIFYDGIYSKTNHPDLITPSFSPQPRQRVRINRLETELKEQGIEIPYLDTLIPGN